MTPDGADRVQASGSDPSRRVLLRGCAVASQDPAVGDLVRGDVLVVGDRIEAVAPDLDAAARDGAALVVDATGTLAVPGFQDAHRRSWSMLARDLAVGPSRLAAHVRPEDVHAATRLSALAALDAGITSVLDVADATRTVEHADAGIAAYAAAGVRAVYAVGGPVLGDGVADVAARLAAIERSASSAGALVWLRLAGVGVGLGAGARVERSLTDLLELARRLEREIVADGVNDPAPSATLLELGARGALGPDVTVAVEHLDGPAWSHVAAGGARVALCPSATLVGPTTFDQPVPVQRTRDLDVPAGLGTDGGHGTGSNLLARLRDTYVVQRMAAYRRIRVLDEHAPLPMRPRDALRLATLGGAAVLAQPGVTGTLAPGSAADIVLIRTKPTVAPTVDEMIDLLVVNADVQDVDTVLVGGVVRKLHGRLVDADLRAAKQLADESRRRLRGVAGVLAKQAS